MILRQTGEDSLRSSQFGLAIGFLLLAVAALVAGLAASPGECLG